MTARNATQLVISWNRNPAYDEVANYPIWDPLTLSLLDSSGAVVSTGPDSGLHVAVSAYSADVNASVCVSDYLVYIGLNAVNGQLAFTAGICNISTNVILTFSTLTTKGIVLTAFTVPFNVTGSFCL